MTAETPTQLTSAGTSLPDGYTHRAATLQDVEAAAHLYTAAYHARGEHETFTAEYLRTDWQEPTFNIETDSQVFFNAQGALAGFIAVWDKMNPAHPWMDWEVMPGNDHWQSLSRAVLAWGEQRAAHAIAHCQPDERFAPVTGIDAESPEQVNFMESLGYQTVRYFYRMGITMTEAPTVLDLPDGFTLRSFDYPSELETLITAKDDMWQDHYGYIKRPLADIVTDWKHGIESDNKFDPAMWYVATDNATGEIAGLVLARIEDYTNEQEGYIQIVGVRRAYRKRGLAQAMLTHAFADYWQRGQKTVCLGVDASSPTGATRLYERVGMSPMRRFIRMEKEVRPGVERMNTGD